MRGRRRAWGGGLALATLGALLLAPTHGTAAAPPQAGAAAPPAAAAGAASATAGATDARLLYLHHCSGCHLADGSAAPGSTVPPLRHQVGRFLRVPDGRAYLVQVPGVSNTPLSDAQTAALMNWVLREIGLESTPDDAPPYTAAEVATLRRAPRGDIPARRRELLRRLAANAAGS